MSTLELKEFIHRQIDGVDDERFLNAIYSMLNSYVKDEDITIGYKTTGEPITRNILKNEVEEAEIRIDNDEYTTQEKLKQESKNW